MSQALKISEDWTPPSHVPAHLVKMFDYVRDPALKVDPWARIIQLAAEGPDIFYSPAMGGHWVLTRHADIFEVMCDPERFSNIPAAIGPSRFPVRLIPTEMDPPEHGEFRKILFPMMAPKAVAAMRDDIQKAAELIVDRVVGAGQCEFIQDVAKQMPTMIFTKLMGVPFSEVPRYLAWVENYLHNPDVDAARRAGDEIFAHLKHLIDERRAAPGNDIIGRLLTATVNGRPLTENEIHEYGILVFTGGLDTLIAVMGYAFRHLAEHPEQQDALRGNPALLRSAAIEMFRLFSVVSRSRHCTRDLEFRGLQMKKGDALLVAGAFASLDPTVFPNPLEAKLDRKNNQHNAFSFGPHRCLGAWLSEAELEALMAAWLDRIPRFRIKPGTTFTHATGIFGLNHLPLEWAPTQSSRH